jgi:transcriptional regulator with XRE-family HTH domain
MTIGARFRQLRLANTKTQEEIGALCGVTKGMVSQWESDHGIPSTDRLIELRKTIDFSLDWLLTDSGTMDGKGNTPYPHDPIKRELMAVAEKLPDYAIAKLTRVGDSYAELIDEAQSRKSANGDR